MNPAIVVLLALGIVAFRKKDALGNEITMQLQVDDFTRWDELFRKYGRLYDCPWRWLKAICWVESDLGRDPSVLRGMQNPGAVNSVSEDGLSYGLMQLTIPTANRSRVRPGTTMRDLNNPEISIVCAAKYLHELGVYYFGWNREGCIRGYNGGPGWKGSSQKSLDMTADYYDKFQSKLDSIIGAQPGDEMERG